MRTPIVVTAAAFAFLAAGAQAAAQERRGQGAARAALEAKSGSNVSGEVTFEEIRGRGVLVRVNARNVPPGLHGFHIHEKGDCSAPDATSAGGHFNPANRPHGAPGAKRNHAGDLGNLLADEGGNIKYESLHEGFTLARGRASALGKAVVLHAKPDDLKSQPAGDAGGRIACGVIQPVNPRPGGEQTRR